MKQFEEFLNEAKSEKYLVTVKEGDKVLKQQRVSEKAGREMLMRLFTETRGADSASLQVPQMLADLDAGKRETIGLTMGNRQMIVQLV